MTAPLRNPKGGYELIVESRLLTLEASRFLDSARAILAQLGEQRQLTETGTSITKLWLGKELALIDELEVLIDSYEATFPIEVRSQRSAAKDALV